MHKLAKFSIGFLTAALLSVGVAGNAAAADRQFVTIGTGAVTGVYYPTGGAICRLVNKSRKEHGIRCSVESTGGSVYNLNTIRAGELDMGVAQSDWQFHAVNGTSVFEEQGPFEDLRAMFSVHSEPFTVVARKDSGITTFDDLKGKRVNIGNPGSGQRGTMEVLMGVKGWTKEDFALTTELKAAEQSQALCDNKIDAMVYVVGHPNGSVQEATTACESVLVPVEVPEIEDTPNIDKLYDKAVIPGGMYRGNPDDVTTFGVKATFVSTAALDDAVAYEVVKAVFENFDDFRRLHPAFAKLEKENMVRDGSSAPTHDGAAKYFKEAGLMQE